MPHAEKPDAAELLSWYDRHRRALPWRTRPGERADPYRVWLSEIMLQQTTVATVAPYYEKFLARFPDVRALADAPEEAVLQAWAGMGYYARARNLQTCAKIVAARGGVFPADLNGLRTLPGVGTYTAAAIGAIAFGIPVVPVDGNVERVAARLNAIKTPLPAAKPELAAAASRLGDDPAARARASDFAQALFDLGATICTPRTPSCALCPWQAACAGHAAGIAADLPRRLPKSARLVRHGAHFWLTDSGDRVLLRRRPPTGLLAGMTELPGTPWRTEVWTEAEALSHAPMPAQWRNLGEIQHIFTHFELRITLFSARVREIRCEGVVRSVTALADEALPSVMRKCVRLAMEREAPPP